MYFKVKKCSHALLCEPALMLDVIVSQLGVAAAPGMGRQASSDGPHSEVYGRGITLRRMWMYNFSVYIV